MSAKQTQSEINQIVASNLTVSAALLQVANAIKSKTTTSDGDREALNLFQKILSQLAKGNS